MKDACIIAICTCYSDNVRVRRTTSEKLKHKPAFSVYQQYSREIYNRYKLLIPKLKELQIQKTQSQISLWQTIRRWQTVCIYTAPGAPPHIPGQRNNVCGIKSKMLNPDFELLIKKKDILIFVEIKTIEFDHFWFTRWVYFFCKT
jgi:hypothetical protein